MAGMSDSAEKTLRALWDRIDQRDWAGLGELLDPGLQTRYLATGELLDGALAYVRLNAEYPGRWRATVLDLVADGDRAVSCARVFDADGGGETHFVTSFATVRGGVLTGLTELWAEADQAVAADRRPAPAGVPQPVNASPPPEADI
jgi:hypothetical protein